MEIDNIEIGYKFKNKDLIRTALTHSSFANECKTKSCSSNERLEFLGDSVLSVIVSDYLYKNFPKLPEGELTKIRSVVVCEPALANMAQKLGFGDKILLSRGEESTGGRMRHSILSDAFEAVLAAIYMDAGIETARAWLMPQVEMAIKEASKGKIFGDYKTAFQERVQSSGKLDVEYILIGESGPDHNKVFEVLLKFNGTEVGRGYGKNKKEAEQSAAKAALETGL